MYRGVTVDLLPGACVQYKHIPYMANPCTIAWFIFFFLHFKHFSETCLLPEMVNNLITVVCCTFHQPAKVSVGKITLESLRSRFLATSHA